MKWTASLDDEILAKEAARISMGDAVLLKGSRAVGVERVLQAITQRHESFNAQVTHQP